jgi:hypothetical protein
MTSRNGEPGVRPVGLIAGAIAALAVAGVATVFASGVMTPAADPAAAVASDAAAQVQVLDTTVPTDSPVITLAPPTPTDIYVTVTVPAPGGEPGEANEHEGKGDD